MATESDDYRNTAVAYDLFAAPYRGTQLKALEALVPTIDPDCGPVLDIGAGNAANMVVVLEKIPTATVVGLEPSHSMRGLALQRLMGRAQWRERATLRPEDFFSATLPPTISGAILMGVIGHFDSGERAAVFAEMAARLAPGAAMLFDLQPLPPEGVSAYEFSVGKVGTLEYRGIAEAWPVEGDTMQWRMTYLCLEGERVLTEDTAEFIYRHPSLDTVGAEAERTGLRLIPAGDSGYWLAVK